MPKLTKKEKENILSLLEELATKIGVEIEYANLLPEYREAGKCRIIDKQRIIIERRLHLNHKIELLIDNLKTFNLNDIFIPPLIRPYFD